MVEEQADGAYPRLNAALVQSGRFESQIVSLVGKFQPHNGMSGMSHNARSFTACDNGTLTLTTEHVDPTVLHQLDNTEMVYEIVGQIAAGNAVTVFVIRELSLDMDLDVYNQMIALQHDPKYAHYFKSAPVSAATPMATN